MDGTNSGRIGTSQCCVFAAQPRVLFISREIVVRIVMANALITLINLGGMRRLMSSPQVGLVGVGGCGVKLC